ncbi:hypothetical protein CEXT_559821 [Caerostris extrusa]|uniref:Uncharacterized protein n=1 Tax=Caerostris extrusa TaxID=172846 RepID=A0AAV4ME22_CAEEX|nr:hypothetical protein CEXT_559821 [Caerostris extrusa]
MYDCRVTFLEITLVYALHRSASSRSRQIDLASPLHPIQTSIEFGPRQIDLCFSASSDPDQDNYYKGRKIASQNKCLEKSSDAQAGDKIWNGYKFSLNGEICVRACALECKIALERNLWLYGKPGGRGATKISFRQEHSFPKRGNTAL